LGAPDGSPTAPRDTVSHAYRKKDANGKPTGAVFIGFTDKTGRAVQKATKARTLTEGKRLAQEVEAHENRLLRGLEEPLPPDHTFSEVIDDYLASDAKFLRSVDSLRARAERIRNEIGGRHVRDITGPLITAMLAAMKEQEAFKPQTLAHHRTLTGTLLGHAIKLGWLRGKNPINDAPTIEVVPSDVTIIEPDDVPAVVAAFPSWWHPPCATAVYVGARKGELIGLLRKNVNTKLWTLKIDKSYDGPTKSAKPRVVPIPPELRPHIEQALATARRLGSMHLFPRRDGRMATRNLDLAGMMKRALVKAGRIDHWELRCRKKGCGHVEQCQVRADVRCPKCTMKLWPKPIAPTDIKFKSLRATFGTVACEVAGGTDYAKVALGHASQKTTEKHYIAARAARLHEMASRVLYGVPPPPPNDAEDSTAATAGKELA
jgi:integrase